MAITSDSTTVDLFNNPGLQRYSLTSRSHFKTPYSEGGKVEPSDKCFLKLL